MSILNILIVSILLLLIAIPLGIYEAIGNPAGILSYRSKHLLDNTTNNIIYLSQRSGRGYAVPDSYVAYMESGNVFLVAWIRVTNEYTNSGRLYGAFIVNNTCVNITKLSNQTAIYSISPPISDGERFFLAYSKHGGTTNMDVYGVFIEWINDQPQIDVRVIANMSSHEDLPLVAYINGSFILVYHSTTTYSYHGVKIDPSTHEVIETKELKRTYYSNSDIQYSLIPGETTFALVHRFYGANSTWDIMVYIYDLDFNLVDSYVIATDPLSDENLYMCFGNGYMDGKYYFLYNRTANRELHLVIVDPSADTFVDNIINTDVKTAYLTTKGMKPLIVWNKDIYNGTVYGGLVQNNGSLVVRILSNDTTGVYREGLVWADWTPLGDYYVVLWGGWDSNSSYVFGRSINVDGFTGPLTIIDNMDSKKVDLYGVFSSPTGLEAVVPSMVWGNDSDSVVWVIEVGLDIPEPVPENLYLVAVASAMLLVAVISVVRRLR